MKTNKAMALLSLVFASAFILSACNSSSSSESTSTEPTTSETPVDPVVTHTVKFVSEGVVLQTSEVVDGECAVYEGEEPTKQKDETVYKYGFWGWDRRLSEPITEDTTFNARFGGYQQVMMLDDFESYTSSGRMKEAGWGALGYSNSAGWTSDTKAAVGLGSNSLEANKALQFDAWENGSGYKFINNKLKNKYQYGANALKFRLMVPSINKVKVLIYSKTISVTDADGTEKLVEPKFVYNLPIHSDEYVEYTLPFNSDKWLLWEKAGDTMVAMASWLGMHQDEIVTLLTKIEFYIEGNDGVGRAYSAHLDSISFVTLDNPSESEITRLSNYSVFTGKTTSNQTVKMELLENNAAKATVIDAQVPQVINGTYQREGLNISFTSEDQGETLVFNGKLSHNGKRVDFVSASGTLKPEVNGMTFNAVQTVEDFESYTADGEGYTTTNPETSRSGLRGNYYIEYYKGSDEAPFGGSGWSLLDETTGSDKLTLSKDSAVAHSGNNCAVLVNEQNLAYRYMQWGLFDGKSCQRIYHGSYLGFWAKSSGVVPYLKVTAFSENKPKVNSEQCVTDYVPGPNPNGGWKHFEIALKDVNYYGFAIMIEKNKTANTTLLIDDIEIYTASPYATYQTPAPEPEFVPGSLYTSAVDGLFNVNLEIVDAENVKLTCGKLASPALGTYVRNNDEVTMTFESVTYVATIKDNFSKLAFKSVSGSGDVKDLLQNLSFTGVDMLETCDTYTQSGQMYCQKYRDIDARSGARGAYYCDYNGGGSGPVGGQGWCLMGGEGNQLELDTTTSYTGHNSIKIKQNSSMSMRYFQWGLFDGTAKPHTGVDGFAIYMKNTNSFVGNFKIHVYTAQKVNPSNVTTYRISSNALTIPANADWTKFTLELNPNKTYYGFAIECLSGSSTGMINFDNAYFYTNTNDPSLLYHVKKGVVLSGPLYQSNVASIRFGDSGTAYLTYARFEFDNVEIKYTTFVVDTDQMMTFDAGDAVVTGRYSINFETNVVTFTITASSGLYGGAFPVGSVLSSQTE